MPSVLFICTANRFRSPIAEAYFRSLLPVGTLETQWTVGSAGTWAKPGLSVLPSAEWSQVQFGLCLSEHRSRPVSRALLADYDLIVVMERNQKESLGIEFPEIRPRLFLLSEFSGGPLYDIPDPFQAEEQTQVAYLEAAQEMINLVWKSFEAICSQAEHNGR